LPSDCPANEPSPNRKLNMSRTSGASLRAIRHWRTSPGGSTPSSSRSRPVEPPSSLILTSALSVGVACLSPCRSVKLPVPPPIMAIRGRYTGFEVTGYLVLVVSQQYSGFELRRKWLVSYLEITAPKNIIRGMDVWLGATQKYALDGWGQIGFGRITGCNSLECLGGREP